MIDNKFEEFNDILIKIIKSFLKEEINETEISDVRSPISLLNSSVIIYTMGVYRSLIIMTIDSKTELNLTKKFCANNKIKYSEKIADKINIIGELLNIILGNFCVYFKNDNFQDITSPNFIKGSKTIYFSNTTKTKQFTYHTAEGNINIIIELSGYKSVINI
jgi:CheY-specific phosphatase CheX